MQAVFSKMILLCQRAINCKLENSTMKAVILAGGYGTRISEETHLKPKPMIEIGGKPILWHIMKIFSAHNVQDFIICLGYKGYLIKEYFMNYYIHNSDITLDLKKNTTKIHQNYSEPWTVTLVDTGEHTMTGGRLKKVRHYLGDEDFFFTYGDGVGNVNITELYEFHQNQKTLATVTVVQPPGRFGSLSFENCIITEFREKPPGDGSWINGGFFVLNTSVIDRYIKGPETVWERDPMENLARDRQLSAYIHRGFWRPMDTLRDKNRLEDLWESGQAPWKVW